MARLVPNRDEQFGDGWLSDIEKRFQKFNCGCDAVDFRTAREGKAFLERWAMGITEREFRQCGGRRRESGRRLVPIEALVYCPIDCFT
jgi:hypothetical protein